METIAILGLVSGLVAIAGVGYTYGRLCLKVEMMWRAFNKSLDTRNGDIFEDSSPRKLTEKGERELCDETKRQIEQLAKTRMHALEILDKIEIRTEAQYVAARVYLEQYRQHYPNRSLLRKLLDRKQHRTD